MFTHYTLGNVESACPTSKGHTMDPKSFSVVVIRPVVRVGTPPIPQLVPAYGVAGVPIWRLVRE